MAPHANEESFSTEIGCGISPGRIVALDCEMVGVGKQKRNALARCTIVDYHGYVVYDEYVKPNKEITDYRTKWSGIRPIHMKQALSFKVARKRVLKIIKGKIIVGHSLHNDFRILKINMKDVEVRDISKNVRLRQLADLPSYNIVSLKRLSFAVLGRNIQCGTHCSIEDSVAAMDLYKTVEHEWDTKEKPNINYLSDVFWPT